MDNIANQKNSANPAGGQPRPVSVGFFERKNGAGRPLPANSPDPNKGLNQDATERKVNIRTMKSDIDTLLKTTKPSLIQMLSAEAGKATPRPRSPKLSEHKNVIAIGVVTFFLVTAGLFSYWWFSLPKEPAESTLQKLIPAAPVFAVESSRTVAVNLLDRAQFLNLMRDSRNEFERPGTVKRIIIKVTDGPQERFARISDFFNFYKIEVPQNVVAELTGEPMFFFYYGDSGPRLGMTAGVRNEDRALRAALFWEDEMKLTLRPLLFTENSPNENSEFEDRTYKNIDWRFLKLFPEEDLGIAYTAFPAKHIFLLTTGKESMEAVINRLFDAR